MVSSSTALKHRGFALICGRPDHFDDWFQMQQWAFVFVNITNSVQDPIAVAIVGGVRFVAVLCFSLIGGACRQTVMIAARSVLSTNDFHAGCHLSGLAYFFPGYIQLWHI